MPAFALRVVMSNTACNHARAYAVPLTMLAPPGEGCAGGLVVCLDGRDVGHTHS
jgi:hypothetical protein